MRHGIGAEPSEQHRRLLAAGGLGEAGLPEFFEGWQADASLGRSGARLLVEVSEPFVGVLTIFFIRLEIGSPRNELQCTDCIARR
jgi:hypothetical protein